MNNFILIEWLFNTLFFSYNNYFTHNNNFPLLFDNKFYMFSGSGFDYLNFYKIIFKLVSISLGSKEPFNKELKRLLN